jgi:hypothetical protein
MDHELLKAWRKQTWTRRPYIFSEDKEVLQSEEKTICLPSYKKFIWDKDFSGHNQSHFHVGLIPVPFHGDLDSADIFICLINPGLNVLDYYVEGNRAYRTLLLRNLKQKLKSELYPFIPLNPKWHWTSGGIWWHRLFKKIIHELMEKKGLSYVKATKIIAKRIAALELVPYHSMNSGHISRLIKDLPSAQLMKNYVKHEVLPRVAQNKALLVIASGSSMWKIPNGLPNVVYQPKNHRMANLSMKSKGAGKRILDRLLK